MSRARSWRMQGVPFNEVQDGMKTLPGMFKVAQRLIESAKVEIVELLSYILG